ncbi:hypothetical protein L228DRAFT_266678 [Xylona heveae TC161]|uniref:Uncharacterized protein n=1 Tax=Xylona heveae (strain CBS 132557 / TC161) TaxID=1328760 RepID=A0A165I3M9_XYLHT|nr:hypothetical protein L228DRAFT_266678 [Xylona heveae TC161]KZF24331.1 hypothetical protein L228DRAFT_266678 [Xylona heveae TC161]
MFENFSFGAPPPISSKVAAFTHSWNSVGPAPDDVSISPCASPIPYGDLTSRPPRRGGAAACVSPPTSVTDLSQHFSQYNLTRTQAHTGPIWYDPFANTKLPVSASPPVDEGVFCDSESEPNSPPRAPSPSSFTAIRQRRQANTQLQCDPGHLKSLSTLVQQMVTEGHQCCVHSPPSWMTMKSRASQSPPPPSSPGSAGPSSSSSSSSSEAGDADEAAEETMRRRRRTSPRSIMEPSRVRKNSDMSYRSSSNTLYEYNRNRRQSAVSTSSKVRKSGR